MPFQSNFLSSRLLFEVSYFTTIAMNATGEMRTDTIERFEIIVQ